MSSVKRQTSCHLYYLLDCLVEQNEIAVLVLLQQKHAYFLVQELRIFVKILNLKIVTLN